MLLILKIMMTSLVGLVISGLLVRIFAGMDKADNMFIGSMIASILAFTVFIVSLIALIWI